MARHSGLARGDNALGSSRFETVRAKGDFFNTGEIIPASGEPDPAWFAEGADGSLVDDGSDEDLEIGDPDEEDLTLAEEDPLDEELDTEDADEDELPDEDLSQLEDEEEDEPTPRVLDDTFDQVSDDDDAVLVVPRQEGEFVCEACFLVKRQEQLAPGGLLICIDCV